MKAFTKILAVGAACAACCAIPLVGPLLAGAFAGSALAGFGADTLPCTAFIGVLGLTGFLLWRVQRLEAAVCAPSSGCGCSLAPLVLPPARETKRIPIACTLSSLDYKERAARIRNLAARSLRSARRDDLRLVLTYAPEAADEVRALTHEEQACCAFLQFDIQDDGLGVDLTITAPEDARAAADDLFAQFAPELALSDQPTLPPRKEYAL